MNLALLIEKSRPSLAAAVVVVTLLALLYMGSEPAMSRAASTVSDDFIVTQTINDEISFATTAADVSMVGAIDGLTGGYATGTTFAVIRTNDSQGYSMTLGFASTTAMVANDVATNNGYINNYSPTGAAPDYDWTSNGTSAEFGYTVTASSSSDVDQSFLDNGASCDSSGGNSTTDHCWMSPAASSSPETIINRSSAAFFGATTTIKFKVEVPSNPNPGLPSDTYTATATLTATNNP